MPEVTGAQRVHLLGHYDSTKRQVSKDRLSRKMIDMKFIFAFDDSSNEERDNTKDR